tara:strand:+ start:164 stop:919 length:756 start_codon:yes stop_codon:yes gene_type:complete
MGLKRKIKKILYNLKFKKKDYFINIKNNNILVTGSNSGIGLSISKKMLELNNKVFATYRLKSDKLDEIENKNLLKIKCDQNNLSDYINLEKNLKNVKIDIIINCAGIFGPSFKDQEIENISMEKFQEAITINSLSIVKIVQIVLKNSTPKIILNISSDAGSISQNKSGDAYVYRTSKSALNSITKNMSVDLNNRFGTIVLAIDPGNVETGMNPKGHIPSDKCANLILDIISNDVEKFNGKFVNLLNQELSW